MKGIRWEYSAKNQKIEMHDAPSPLLTADTIQGSRRLGSVARWILLWGTIFGVSGVALVAVTNRVVIWSSSDAFCGQFCHSMTWASAGYRQGPHFMNASGVRASCGQCHIPYDSSPATATQYVKMLMFKTQRGAKDFWNEWRKTIATKEEWEKRRPRLGAEFQNYLEVHNYITCSGCHSLEAFAGPRSQMKALIHKDIIKSNDVACLECHGNVGHVYEQPMARVNGWYTAEQAAAGRKLYQAQCATCHGASLEGGAGPSLKGTAWHQMYGGVKLLTVWGEIKGPMAQDTGKTYTTQQSLDILSYLLQQNGLPSGNQPLADTRELSYALPTK